MTHYEVFRECFPELKLTEEHYDKLSEENSAARLSFRKASRW